MHEGPTNQLDLLIRAGEPRRAVPTAGRERGRAGAEGGGGEDAAHGALRRRAGGNGGQSGSDHLGSGRPAALASRRGRHRRGRVAGSCGGARGGV